MKPFSTSADLAAQWANPSDVSTILFIVGGDIIQKAFSQGTGSTYVPVCFSFGCAAYAILALVGILGDGRLLSPPDYPCKVMNLRSGYSRERNNFVLGRLLRDMEAVENRDSETSKEEGDYGLKITIFEATVNKNDMTHFSWSRLHFIGIAFTFFQFLIASIPLLPIFPVRSWNVLLITALGTGLIQWTGSLPQWRAEKLPNRQKSQEVFALTTGNGSRDVMVIIGYGKCLDLESLATMPSPRIGRPWEKFKSLSRPRKTSKHGEELPRHNTMQRNARTCQSRLLKGVPIGFVVTQFSIAIIAVLWILLLINLSASTSTPETWCLLGVGSLGMFQNAWLAAAEIPPESRNIPLDKVDVVKGRKVMHAIMDFHITYRLGKPLLAEFFPGKLRDNEEAWWNGRLRAYERERDAERGQFETPSRLKDARGVPEFVYPLIEPLQEDEEYAPPKN